MRGDYTKEGQ